MTREALEAASETLGEATDDAADDVADRLADMADRVQDLAERDRDPDHGTLARVERKLGSLREDGSEAVGERVDEALEKVREFRSTVEGV